LIVVIALCVWGYNSCASIFTLSPEKQAEFDAEKDRKSKYSDSIMAFTMSKEFVLRELMSPASADFPWFQRSFAVDLGQGRYRISSYVDSQNSFGAMLRTQYECTLKFTSPDSWALESLTFD
jgi:hypothetical protein